MALAPPPDDPRAGIGASRGLASGDHHDADHEPGQRER
jgi:hypothetical protein